MSRDEDRSIIDKYLRAIENVDPDIGTPDQLAADLEIVADKAATAKGIKRVDYVAEMLRIEALLKSAASIEALRLDFVEVVKRYSDEEGLTFAAWREIGVPRATLLEAGFAAAGKPSGKNKPKPNEIKDLGHGFDCGYPGCADGRDGAPFVGPSAQSVRMHVTRRHNPGLGNVNQYIVPRTSA